MFAANGGCVSANNRTNQSACCAAVGTFLIGLGIDLIAEKQDGMSFALRFFFDRNNSHFLVRLTSVHLLRGNLRADAHRDFLRIQAIVHKGYNPSLTTQIVLGASIGAM